MKCCTCKCDIESENAIYAPKRKVSYWFCLDCYKKSSYYNEKTFNILVEETRRIIREKEFTRKFCELMLEHFGELDNQFFIRKGNINKGNFSTKQFNSEYCRFTISDEELLDMLEKMIPYLKKVTQKFNRNGRGLLCNYVLSILYNSYPKYSRAKLSSENHNEEQIKQTVSINEIDESLIKRKQNIKETENLNLQEFLL